MSFESPPSNCPTCLPPWVQRYRLHDWALVIGMEVASLVVRSVVVPMCLPFAIGDPSISNPMLPSTFGGWSLLAMALLPCFAYGFLVAMWPTLGKSATMRGEGKWRRFRVELNLHVLMQATSIALALFVVTALKKLAGRLRPDFVERVKLSSCNMTLVSTAVDCCTGDSLVNMGRTSFPSGHSAIALSSLLTLGLVLAKHLVLSRHGSVWRLLIAASPACFGFVVCVSRTIDHRHHFSDIVAGAIIGTAAAAIAFWLMEANLATANEAEQAGTSVLDAASELVPRFEPASISR